MIALYIRLSMTDENLGGNKEESNSITNQRELLYDAVRRHDELAGDEVEEFVDDGYSGMNFERPAFRRMMELVRRRIVTVIIVKDFSRFGRDYIEMGNYMERVFPLFGVRFLSVSDGYDSVSRKVCDYRELEVVVNNIMNSYYSRDLSDKICSTIRARRQKGDYVYSGRAFGYLEDPDNPARIVIDPEAGEYVRLMFDLAICGSKTGEIARELNKRQIPTCSEYNDSRHIKGKGGRRTKGEKSFWDAQKVARLLADPVYAGAYVSSKRRRIVPGRKEMRDSTSDEQVWIYQHHPAIVTMEEFEAAQKVFKVVEKHRALSPSPLASPICAKDYPLKGKVICGKCGYTMLYMQRKVMGSYYVCSSRYKSKIDLGCGEDRFDESFINQYVLEQLRLAIPTLRRVRDQLREAEGKRAELAERSEKELRRIQMRIQSLKDKKLLLYEDYVDGKLEKVEFLSARDQISSEIQAARAEMAEMEKADKTRRNSSEARAPKSLLICEFEELMRKVSLFEGETDLSGEMAGAFVDRVVVYDESHIQIRWSWEDLLAQARKAM